jgi:uncharacterized integral membrane protein
MRVIIIIIIIIIIAFTAVNLHFFEWERE